MQTNLHLYHNVLARLGQLLPRERITRRRNMALLVVGLYLSRSVHLSLVVRKWPSASKEPSLVNRLRRFLINRRLEVRRWYEPVVLELLRSAAGSPIRLVIDATKVGQHHRLLTIGLAYKRRTLPLVWSVHRGSRGHTSSVRTGSNVVSGSDNPSLFVSRLTSQSDVWLVKRLKRR
ncbi:hypothetical protein FKZ61_015890 [Litorilinea aerophila]|uniref:Transposase n=1 Tax=Litorilinea aerophila TaxID=1204385 RepID=A0A540VD78_9CHLR|nr:hypothetical protein [Litorilinea aerophila]MCC9077583.1 hypothetical protein [Litorilinea aerophila]